MLNDGHLEVKPCELAQMSVGVAVLCSKHGPDLKYPGVSSCKGEEVEEEVEKELRARQGKAEEGKARKSKLLQSIAWQRIGRQSKV